MGNRGRTMIEDEFDFGFATELDAQGPRDLPRGRRRNGAALPGTRMIEGFYREIQAMGGRRWDSSALIRRLRKA